MRQEVHTHRSGRWWAITVPSEPGIHTQARRLDQVKAQAADALSVWHSATRRQPVIVKPEDVDLVVRSGTALDRAFAKARKSAAAADRARSASQAAVRTAVSSARGAGLSVRDIGELLGVSFQRAAVLTRDTAVAS